MKNFEGKTVAYYMGKQTIVSGVVTGCDKDIGVTIQTADKKGYLACLHGPSSPARRDSSAPKSHVKMMFDLMVDMIEAGFVDAVKLIEANGHYSGHGAPSVDDCPFSQ